MALRSLCHLILAAILAASANAQPALKLVRTIPLAGVGGRIDHFSIDSQNHRIFMAALGTDTVEVMDTETGTRLHSITGCSEPQGLLFLPKPNRVFVANGGSGDLRIYDAGNFQLLKTIGSLSDADNVRYDAKNQLVYVGYGDGALAAFDTNGAQLANIPVGGHPESFQIGQSGNRIFVNVPGEGAVVVVDREQKKIIAKWPLKPARSNFPMALDEENHRLFVGCRSPARLLALDTESGKIVAQIEISGDTDDVFYDAKRSCLYVSCGEGFLDVIQRKPDDRLDRVAHEPTRSGARTSYFSAETGRLFLAVPKSWGRDAEVRVYQTLGGAR